LSQDDSESIEQFAFRLRRQADKCNFVNAVDEYIRDQITFKTNNDKLRIHILKHDEIKLDEVIAHGKALEALSLHKKAFEKPSELINKITTSTSGSFKKFECYRCGKRNHAGNDPNCPALRLKCHKCEKTGHYAQKCRTNRSKYDHGVKRKYENDQYKNVKRTKRTDDVEYVRNVETDDF
jgi:hypothetical protein